MKIFTCCTAILLSVFFSSSKDDDSVPRDLLTLDAKNAIYNKKSFDLTQIADTIEFIPLDDTSRESLIGQMRVIEESEKEFYIFEGIDGIVKVFDKTGRFISTRGRVGRGPGEYSYSNGMAIDHITGNVYMNVRARSLSIFRYNPDNHMTASTDPIAFDSYEISYYEGQLIVQNYPYVKPEPDGKITFLDIFSPDLKHEGSIRIPHKATNSYFIRGHQILSNNGKDLLVKEELNDTLFHYREGKLIPAYKLDMGKYFFSHKMWNAAMEDQWKKYFMVDDIYDGDSYMIIIMSNGFMGASGISIIFDKRDPSGGFSAVGPDGKPGLFVDGIKFTPSYIRDNRLVGYMQALDIVDNADAITNPDLKALAATLKEDSNPVIVVAKLKK